MDTAEEIAQLRAELQRRNNEERKALSAELAKRNFLAYLKSNFDDWKQRYDHINETVFNNPWIAGLGYMPHPKQLEFLAMYDKREVFFGGSGAGGKSQSLWFAALQYVHVPGYSALILRRTYADLAKSGALMDRSRQYLNGTDAVWNERDKKWTFPSGASITFGYLQNESDKFQYAGGEYQNISYDELTHFCLTPDHEVLTDTGWSPIADVRPGRRVASLRADGTAGYESVSETHTFDHNGEMVRLDHRSMGFLATPNHRLVVEGQRNGKWRFCEAGSLPAFPHFPFSHTWKGDDPSHVEFSPVSGRGIGRNANVATSIPLTDYLELLGWYLSEGSAFEHGVRSGRRGSPVVSIRQTKPAPTLDALVSRLPWRSRPDGDGGYRIFSRQLYSALKPLGDTYTKRVPRWVMELSRESLEIFYAAFMKGDGHRNRKTGAHGVSLACEGLIDDIQEIASKLGLRSTRRAITVAGKYKAWRLSVHGRQRKLIACPSNFTQERYVGPVHCLTVPATGTFLCRYRGQVFWSGNSESQYTFLFTRLRRARTGELGKVPLRMRSASNPGSSGHLWVFNRFVNDDTRHEGVVYVPSRMQDNPSTDIEEYKESLKNVDPITRRQMEEGDWSAVEGGRFKREWFNRRWRWDANGLDIVLEDNRGPYKFRLAGAPLFVSCDPASSSKTSADFTVFGVWANTPRGDLVWVDCIRRQVDIPDQPKLLEEVYRKHRFKAIGIEAVASNQSMFQFAQRMMLPAVRLTPKGQDKLAHAQQAMILAEQGMVWLPCPSANPTFPFDEVLAELTLFTGTKADRNDDVADALSYGCDMRLKMKYMSGGAAESPGSFNPLTRQRW